ncbi:hypothetical protein LCGC14_3010930, partial [marine sediment metagenome]
IKNITACGQSDYDGFSRLTRIKLVGSTAKTDYLRAEEIPPMVIPDDKDKTAVGQLYPVPEIALLSDSPETFNAPRPQPLAENLFEETVAIQTFGEKHWIAINKPPAEVWPRVRNMLTRGGIPTERVDAQSGLLETGWLQFKDEVNVSHRFRLTITPGVGVKSTEIWLVHMQVTQGEEAKAGTWPEISVSEARDNEFTQRLADALVNDISSGSVNCFGGVPATAASVNISNFVGGTVEGKDNHRHVIGIYD